MSSRGQMYYRRAHRGRMFRALRPSVSRLVRSVRRAQRKREDARARPLEATSRRLNDDEGRVTTRNHNSEKVVQKNKNITYDPRVRTESRVLSDWVYSDGWYMWCLRKARNEPWRTDVHTEKIGQMIRILAKRKELQRAKRMCSE